MKKNKTEKNEKKRKYDKNQLMVKIVAGILVLLIVHLTLHSSFLKIIY